VKVGAYWGTWVVFEATSTGAGMTVATRVQLVTKVPLTPTLAVMLWPTSDSGSGAETKRKLPTHCRPKAALHEHEPPRFSAGGSNGGSNSTTVAELRRSTLAVFTARLVAPTARRVLTSTMRAGPLGAQLLAAESLL
jgi:hypothetical protein